MSGALEGRGALVTGAGRGIGRELAIGLAAAGAQVALVARTAGELHESAARITDAGGKATAIVADIGDADQLREALRAAAEQLGTIQILINNAAVVGPLGPTEALAPDEIRAALAINVAAPVALSGAVIAGMRAGDWGRIVNISSGIAANPAGMVGMTIYAASKAALEAHTLNLAAELDGTGLTVNVYRPGAVDTAMQAWIREQSPDAIGRGLHERFMAMQASGTLLTPEQSAASLLARLPGDETGQIWSAGDPIT